MRDWLNAILVFIGSASLSDLEYAAIDISKLEVQVYNQAAYDALSAVLVARETVSTMQKRLEGFFTAKGLNVVTAQTGKSNIFLGDSL